MYCLDILSCPRSLFSFLVHFIMLSVSRLHIALNSRIIDNSELKGIFKDIVMA
jgi:hypothetical protein